MTLRTLLQSADPVRHEPPLAEAERERIRSVMLRTASVAGSPKSVRPNLTRLAIAAAVVVVLVAIGYQAWSHGTTPLMAAVRFEVRLAEDQPMPGLIVAQRPDAGVIYLHPEMIVNNDDIALSWVSQDGSNQFGVTVQFLPAGAERMRQATTAHVGRPLAIVIDGRVVSAATVRSPIGDSALMSGSYTRAEAERIVDGMKLR